MQSWLTAPLPPPFLRPPAPAELRAPRPDDADALARLMLDAYAGTIDDPGDPSFEYARSEVDKLLRGDFGPFDASASAVIERDSTLASAAIITRDRGEPLLAFSMTAPRWKRHGLARLTLLHAMHNLHARREPRIHLVVTIGNSPAENLYRGMGFVIGVPPPK